MFTHIYIYIYIYTYTHSYTYIHIGRYTSICIHIPRSPGLSIAPLFTEGSGKRRKGCLELRGLGFSVYGLGV